MIRSIPQLEALRGEWERLSARSRSPLLDHDWFQSCAEAFHADGDLRVLTVRRGGALAGIAPLVMERGRRGTRVMMLGVSTLYEPSDWLADSPDTVSALVDAALHLSAPLVLQRIPVASPIPAALNAVPRHRAWTVVRPGASCLAVQTSSSWDQYYGSLSSQITSNLRRVRRKAEKALGPMLVEHHNPVPGEVDVLLERVIQIEGSGWKGRQRSALAARTDLREFFRRYCHRAAAKRQLRVSTLSFGAQLAAVELSVEAYARIWQLKIGYHDGLAAYYPGLHLTEHSIRSAFERGLEAYEFLGSAAAWEERWRPETRTFHTIAVYPTTAPGLLGACQDLTGALWRRWQG